LQILECLAVDKELERFNPGFPVGCCIWARLVYGYAELYKMRVLCADIAGEWDCMLHFVWRVVSLF
jgi:hypothetical protein